MLKGAAGFGKGVADAFLGLPPEAKGLLLALAGINKVSGGAVVKVGLDLGKDVFGQFFQRGASPANALWVQSVGGTGGTGGAPGAGGGGLVNGVVTAGGLAIGAAELAALPGEIGGLGKAFDGLSNKDLPAAKQGLQDFVNSMTGLNPFGPNPALFQTALDALPTKIATKIHEDNSPDAREQRSALTRIQQATVESHRGMVNATRSSESAIVRAIERNRAIVHVTVSNRTVTSVYASGRTVTRTASTGSYNAGLYGG